MANQRSYTAYGPAGEMAHHQGSKGRWRKCSASVPEPGLCHNSAWDQVICRAQSLTPGGPFPRQMMRMTHLEALWLRGGEGDKGLSLHSPHLHLVSPGHRIAGLGPWWLSSRVHPSLSLRCGEGTELTGWRLGWSGCRRPRVVAMRRGRRAPLFAISVSALLCSDDLEEPFVPPVPVWFPWELEWQPHLSAAAEVLCPQDARNT